MSIQNNFLDFTWCNFFKWMDDEEKYELFKSCLLNIQNKLDVESNSMIGYLGIKVDDAIYSNFNCKNALVYSFVVITEDCLYRIKKMNDKFETIEEISLSSYTINYDNYYTIKINDTIIPIIEISPFECDNTQALETFYRPLGTLFVKLLRKC